MSSKSGGASDSKRHKKKHDGKHGEKVKKKKTKPSDELQNLDKAPFDVVLKRFRQNLITEKVLLKAKEVDMESTKQLSNIIYAKFRFDVQFTNPQVQNEIIWFYLNAIIVPCFSLIIDLEDDILWNSILTLHIILSNKVNFLSDEEKEDILFRVVYCRAQLKHNVKIPLKDEIKDKVISNGSNNIGKFGNSDALYLLRKLSKSRLIDDEDKVSFRTTTYRFFLNLISINYMSSVVDNDLTWFVQDLWPPRIESVFCNGSEATSVTDAIKGSQFLSLHDSKIMYKDNNLERITLLWTDGLMETYELKHIVTNNDELQQRRGFIDILVALICELQECDKACQFEILMEIIGSHFLKDGKEYHSFHIDIALLLEKCYKRNPAVAYVTYKKLLSVYFHHNESMILSSKSIGIMKSWSTQEIITDNFIDFLTKSMQDPVALMNIIISLGNHNGIDNSLPVYWMCLKKMFFSGKEDWWEHIFNTLINKLPEVIDISLKVNCSEFFDLIGAFAGHIEENEISISFVIWVLSIATKNNSLANEEVNRFIKAIVINRKRFHGGGQIPFQIILDMLLCNEKVQDNTMLVESTYNTVNLFCCYIGGFESSKELIKEELGIIQNIFSILFKIMGSENEWSCEKVNDIRSIIFQSFIEFIVNVPQQTQVATIRKMVALKSTIAECFIHAPLKTNMLSLIFPTLLSRELEEVTLILLHKVFTSLFDHSEIQNEHCIAELFRLFCEALVNGNGDRFQVFFEEYTLDIISGFTHRIFFIRESCVKAICYIMNVEKDVKANLLFMVNGNKKCEHEYLGKKEEIMDGFNTIDILSMYLKLSWNDDATKGVFSKELCQEEIIKLDKLVKEKILVTSQNTQNLKKTSDIDKDLAQHMHFHKTLVETKTMLHNLATVLNVVINPINLLLQGETGAGKTAIVIEAARRYGAPIIRFNMSSSTTIANIFGAAVPQDQNGKIVVQFQDGPFTTAFRKGAWLLLDEFNLAPENVLSSIENALDTSILFLPTETAEISKEEKSFNEQRYIEYKRHEDFRLLCTQNPSTGMYRGKREKHSSAMLSRFSPVIIESPDKEEKIYIVQDFFTKNGVNVSTATTLSKKIITTHCYIDQLFKSDDFSEKGFPYLEVTLRDALRWTERSLPLLSDEAAINSVPLIDVAKIGYEIYCSRLRNPENITKVKKKIVQGFGFEFDFTTGTTDQHLGICEKEKGVIHLGNRKFMFDLPSISNNSTHGRFCIELFKLVYGILGCDTFRKGFLPAFGHDMYDFFLCIMTNEDLLMRRLHRCANYCLELTGFCSIREKFLSKFGDLVKSSYRHVYVPDVDPNHARLYRPMIAVTEDVKSCWLQIMTALQCRQPVLLTGLNGVGKSSVVDSLGRSLQKKLVHLYITPETEPEILVGNFVPKDKGVVWQEGVVTKAVREGCWIVFENLSEAQSTVLERLNSVLENPPMWTVTENIEKGTEVVKVNSEFRVLATMTPPSSGKTSERLLGANIVTNSELSPALYNRFSIINLDNQHTKKKSLNEIYQSLVDRNSALLEYEEKFVTLFLQLQQIDHSVLNLHHFTKVVIGASKLLHLDNIKFGAMEALYLGIELNMTGAFFQKSNDIGIKAVRVVKSVFPTFYVNGGLFSDIFNCNDKSYVLDRERSKSCYENACLLSASISCGFPALLEGPAATGKTSLVKFLASCFNKSLERVNNTENTSVNDYLGSIMPNGHYAPGPLVRAMTNGNFFLADEFDLAEPAVLNMLYPLLEGKKTIRIPSTNEIVTASDSFRFFATQNGASYSGRKELPQSLKSRFTLVTFKEFSEEEIKFIIERRSEFFLKPNMHDEIKSKSENLARAYYLLNKAVEKHPLFGTNIKVTIREILKWINRKQMFNASWGIIGFQLFSTRVNEEDINELASVIKTAFPDCTELDTPESCKPIIIVDRENQRLVNKQNPDQHLASFKVSDVEFWDMLYHSAPPFLEQLWNLCIAVQCKEPVLLIGPTSFKSHLIDTWCKMYQRTQSQVVVLCNQASDSADFLGRLRPYSLQECLNLLCIVATQFVAVSRNLLDELFSYIGEERKHFVAFLETKIELLVAEVNAEVNACSIARNKNFEEVKEDFIDSASESSESTVSSTGNSEDSIDQDYENESLYVPSEDEAIGFQSDSENSLYSNDLTSVRDSDCSSDESSDHILEQGNDLSQIVKEDEIIGDDSSTSESDVSSYENEDDEISYRPDKIFDLNFTKLKDISESLQEKMAQFLRLLREKLPQKYVIKTNTLSIIFNKFATIVKNGLTGDSHNVIFLFQDGPCTTAVKEGHVLILENIHLPSQAVTERLNSLLEIEPSFTLYEDLDCGKMDGDLSPSNLSISNSLVVFGTVHTSRNVNRSKITLSPAIRSRMTELIINSYTKSELVTLSNLLSLQNVLETEEFSQLFCKLIFLFNKYMIITSRDIIKLKKFVSLQNKTYGRHEDGMFLKLLIWGITFLWIDCIQLSLQRIVFKDVLDAFNIDNHAEMWSIFDGETVKNDFWADVTSHCGKNYASLIQTPFRCSLAPGVNFVKPLHNLCLSKTAYRNICRVFAAAECGMKLLLNGPPGIGKTKIIQELAVALGYKCVRINFSANTTYEDLVGSFVPKVVDGRRTFEFIEGELLKAVKDSENIWLLLDEINLAHPVVLEKLIPIFASHSSIRIDAIGEEVVLGNVHIFATKNPESIGGGRSKLHESVLAHFTTLNLSDFNDEELYMIGTFKMVSGSENSPVGTGAISARLVPDILKFHLEVTKNDKFGARIGDVPFNLRDLVKFIRVAETNSEFHKLAVRDIERTVEAIDIEGVRIHLELVYAKRLEKEEDRHVMRKLIDKHFPPQNSVINGSDIIVEDNLKEFLRIGFIYLKKGNCHSGVQLPFFHTKLMKENLISLAAASRTGHTVLLRGGNSSGKTSLIMELSRLAQRRLITYQMNKDTTTSDLIGSWTVSNEKVVYNKLKVLINNTVHVFCQLCFRNGQDALFQKFSEFYSKHRNYFRANNFNFALQNVCNVALDFCSVFYTVATDLQHPLKEIIKNECAKMEELIKCEAKCSSVNFVFVEGPLLEAVRNGYWFLLDNLGQAPGDVMERLNSLAESDPQLVLFEGGKHEVLTRQNVGIHKDFRLFGTVSTDRSRGNNISDAFLNRCIVLNLSPIDYDPEVVKEVDKPINAVLVKSIPSYEILSRKLSGIQNKENLVKVLVKLHLEVLQMNRLKQIELVEGYKYTFRNLLLASNIILNDVKSKEITILESLRMAINRCYCDPLIKHNHKSDVFLKYASILKDEVVEIPEKNIWQSDDSESNDIVTEFGNLSSDTLLFVLLSMGKVNNFNKKNPTVISFLSSFLQSLQQFLQTYKMFIKERFNVDVIISIEEWLKYDTHSNAANAFLEKMKIFEIIDKDIYENIDFINENISTNLQIFNKKLRKFVSCTTLIDSKERQAKLISANKYWHILLEMFQSMRLLLEAEYQPKSLLEKVDNLLEPMQNLNIGESFEKSLRLICEIKHNEIISYMAFRIESLEERHKRELFQQTMSYVASNVEKALNLPLVSNSEIRYRAVTQMIDTFSDISYNSNLMLQLCKMEFLSLKLACDIRTPDMLLHGSIGAKEISIALLCKVNFLGLLCNVLKILVKHTNEFCSLKSNFLKVRKFLSAFEKIGHVKTLNEFTQLSPDEFALGNEELRVNEQLKTAKELQKNLTLICENVVAIREKAEFLDLIKILSSVHMYMRSDIILQWCASFNSGKKFEYFSSLGITGVDEENILDVVAFFRLVEQLSKDGLQVQIAILENLVLALNMETILFEDVQFPYLIILSENTGLPIIIDRKCLVTVNGDNLKIYCCQVYGETDALAEITSKLVLSCCRNGLPYQLIDLFIENSDGYTLDGNLLLTTCIVRRFFNSAHPDSMINIQEKEMLDLKKEIKMHQVVLTAKTGEISLGTAINEIDSVVNLFETLDNGGYNFSDFSNTFLKLECFIQSRLDAKVKHEHQNLMIKTVPKTLNDKAKLYSLLKFNKDKLFWLNAVREISEELRCNHNVQQYVIIHNIFEEYRNNVTRMFLMALSLKGDIAYSYCHKATQLLFVGFLRIVANVSVKNKELTSCSNLIKDVKSVCEMVNNFLEDFPSAKKNRIYFNVNLDELEAMIINNEPKTISTPANVSNNYNSAEMDLRNQKVGLLQKDLNRLSEKASNYNLHGLLQDVVEIKSNVRLIIDELSYSELYQNLEKRKEEVKERIDTSCREIEEERKTDAFSLPGVLKLNSAKDITKNEMTITGTNELGKNLKDKVPDLLKMLAWKDKNFKTLTSIEFERLLKLFLRATNTQKALELAVELHEIISSDLPEVNLKTKTKTVLVKIEKFLDFSDALLNVCNIKYMVNQEMFIMENILQEVLVLISVVSERRLNILNEIKCHSTNEIIQFASIDHGQKKVCLWFFSEQFKELLLAKCMLVQLSMQLALQNKIIVPSYITLSDFIYTFTESAKLQSLLRLSQKENKLSPLFTQELFLQEVKNTFSIHSNPLFDDMYLSQINRYLFEGVMSVMKSAIHVNDHNSNALVACFNSNFVCILMHFWANSEFAAQQVQGWDHEFCKSLINNSKIESVKFRIQETIKEKENQENRLKQYTDEFKQKEKHHKNTLQSFDNATANIDAFFESSHNIKLENDEWERETMNYEKKVFEVRNMIAEYAETLHRMNEEVEKLVRKAREDISIWLEKFGPDFSVLLQRVLECFSVTLEDTEGVNLSQYIRSLEYYKKLMVFENNFGEKEKLERLQQQLVVYVNQVDNVCTLNLKKLANITDETSFLYNIFKKLIYLGNATVSSLHRVVYDMSLSVQSEIEQHVSRRFYSLKNSIGSIVNKIINEKHIVLKQEHITMLIDFHNELEGLNEQTVQCNKLYHINVSFLNSFFSRFLLYCAGTFQELTFNHEFISSLLKSSKMRIQPKGHAACQNLFRRILTEKQCIDSDMKGFSLHSVSQELTSLCENFTPEQKLKGDGAEDVIQEKNIEIITSIINASNLVNTLKLHLEKILMYFKEHALDEKEYASFQHVVTVLTKVACLCSKSYVGENHYLKLAEIIHNYTVGSSETSCGYIQLLAACEDLTETMHLNRNKLKSRTEEIQRFAKKIASFFVTIMLHRSFRNIVMLSLDNILTYNIFTDNNTSHGITYSFLLREYCYHGLQDMLKLSIKYFDTDSTYTDLCARFQSVILFALEGTTKIGDLLYKTEEDLEEQLKQNRPLISIPGLSHLNDLEKIMTTGLIRGHINVVKKKVQSLTKKMDKENYIECFFSLLDEWKAATNVLTRMHSAAANKCYEEQRVHYELELKEIEKESVENERKYKDEVKSYETLVQRAQTDMEIACQQVVIISSTLNAKKDPTNNSRYINRLNGLIKTLLSIEKKLLKKQIITGSVSNKVVKKINKIYLTFDKLYCNETFIQKKVDFENRLVFKTECNGNEESTFLSKENIGFFDAIYQKVLQKIRSLTALNLDQKRLFCVQAGQQNVVKIQILSGDIILFETKMELEWNEEEMWNTFGVLKSFDASLQYHFDRDVKVVVCEESPLQDQDSDSLFDMFKTFEEALDSLKSVIEFRKPTKPERRKPQEHPSHYLKDKIKMCSIDLLLKTQYYENILRIKSMLDNIFAISSSRHLFASDFTISQENVLELARDILECYDECKKCLESTEALMKQYEKEYKLHFAREKHLIAQETDLVEQKKWFFSNWLKPDIKQLCDVYNQQQKDTAVKLRKKTQEFLKFMNMICHSLSSSVVYLANALKEQGNINSNIIDRAIKLLETKLQIHLYKEHGSKIKSVIFGLKTMKSENETLIENMRSLDTLNIDIKKLDFCIPDLCSNNITHIKVNEKNAAESYCSVKEAVINFGTVIKNFPQVHGNIPCLIIRNYLQCCSFEIMSNSAVIQPISKGFVEGRAQRKLFLSPNIKNAIPGLQEEICNLKIKTSSCSHWIPIKIIQEVLDFQAEKVLPNFVVDSNSKESNLVLDIGKISQNFAHKTQFQLKNPFSISLRIKMINSSKLNFSNNNILLKPGEAHFCELILNPEREEGFHKSSTIIYFAEDVFVTVCVKYQVCKLKVQITLDEKHISCDIKKVSLTIQSLPLKLFKSDLKLRNMCSLPLYVTLSMRPSTQVFFWDCMKSKELLLNDIFNPNLAKVQDFTEEDARLLFELSVKDQYKNNLNQIQFELDIESRWPKIELRPKTLDFELCYVGKYKEVKLNLKSVEATVKVFSIIPAEFIELTELRYPLLIERNKTVSVPVRIYPPNNIEFKATITLDTNCEVKNVTHTIKCTVRMPIIRAVPAVIDLGEIDQKTNKHVSISVFNEGNFPDNLKIKTESPKLMKVRAYRNTAYVTHKSEIPIDITTLNVSGLIDQYIVGFVKINGYVKTLTIPILGVPVNSKEKTLKVMDKPPCIYPDLKDVSAVLNCIDNIAVSASPFVYMALLKRQQDDAEIFMHILDKIELSDKIDWCSIASNFFDLNKEEISSLQKGQVDTDMAITVAIRFSRHLKLHFFGSCLEIIRKNENNVLLISQIIFNMCLSQQKALTKHSFKNVVDFKDILTSMVIQDGLSVVNVYVKCFNSIWICSDPNIENLAGLLKSVVSISKTDKSDAVIEKMKIIYSTVIDLNLAPKRCLDELVLLLDNMIQGSCLLDCIQAFLKERKIKYDLSAIGKVLSQLENVKSKEAGLPEIFTISRILSVSISKNLEKHTLHEIYHVITNLLNKLDQKWLLSEYNEIFNLFFNLDCHGCINLSQLLEIAHILSKKKVVERFCSTAQRVEFVLNGKENKMDVSVEEIFDLAEVLIPSNTKDKSSALNLLHHALRIGNNILQEKDLNHRYSLNTAIEILGDGTYVEVERENKFLSAIELFGDAVISTCVIHRHIILRNAGEFLSVENAQKKTMVKIHKKADIFLKLSCEKYPSNSGLLSCFKELICEMVPQESTALLLDTYWKVLDWIDKNRYNEIIELFAATEVLFKGNSICHVKMAGDILTFCSTISQKKDIRHVPIKPFLKDLRNKHKNLNIETNKLHNIISEYAKKAVKNFTASFWNAKEILPDVIALINPGENAALLMSVLLTMEQFVTSVCNTDKKKVDVLLDVAVYLKRLTSLVSDDKDFQIIDSIYNIIHECKSIHFFSALQTIKFCEKICDVFGTLPDAKKFHNVCMVLLNHAKTVLMTNIQSPQVVFETATQISCILKTPPAVTKTVEMAGHIHCYGTQLLKVQKIDPIHVFDFIISVNNTGCIKTSSKLLALSKNIYQAYSDKSGEVNLNWFLESTAVILEGVVNKFDLTEIKETLEMINTAFRNDPVQTMVPEKKKLMKLFEGLSQKNGLQSNFKKLIELFCVFNRASEECNFSHIKSDDYLILGAEIFSVLSKETSWKHTMHCVKSAIEFDRNKQSSKWDPHVALNSISKFCNNIDLPAHIFTDWLETIKLTEVILKLLSTVEDTIYAEDWRKNLNTFALNVQSLYNLLDKDHSNNNPVRAAVTVITKMIASENPFTIIPKFAVIAFSQDQRIYA